MGWIGWTFRVGVRSAPRWHYRLTPSLRDDVLVSRHTQRIEVFSREGDHWTLRVAGPGGAVPLTATPGARSVDRVYRSVELTETPPRPSA